MNKKIIVGIDPGKTCGLAILGIDASPLLVKSYREFAHSDIISTISSYGDPVLVAVDVDPAPAFAEEIARKFNAFLFAPDGPIPVVVKQELVRAFTEKNNLHLQDQHQKDSLAAALKAFNSFRNKFEKAEAHTREAKAPVNPDEVKRLLVQGFSIAEAIELLLSEKNSTPRPRPLLSAHEANPKLSRSVNPLTEKICSQNLIIARLKRLNEQRVKEIRFLKDHIGVLEKKLAEAETERYLEIRREYEYAKVNQELENLKRRLSNLERMRTRKPEGVNDQDTGTSEDSLIPLKVISTFSGDEIQRVSRNLGLFPNDVVLLLDGSGGGSATARLLISKNLQAVIIGSNLSHLAMEEFRLAGIPVLKKDSLAVKWQHDIPFIDREALDAAIRFFKRSETEDEEKEIEHLVGEYREERLRSDRDT